MKKKRVHVGEGFTIEGLQRTWVLSAIHSYHGGRKEEREGER